MALSKEKMGGFLNNLNVVSQTRQSDKIKMIEIADLVDSKDNFFEMSKIEELASAILGQGGVRDNLVVRQLGDDKYEIISGHRRKAAVQYLLDNGEKVSSKLPCLVQEYEDEESMKLDLILMNVTARQLSDSELYTSYEILTEIFQKKKEKGEKFGKLRDNLAGMLGVSSSQIGKLQNIDKHGTEEVKDAVKSGDLSISTANQISRLSDEEQNEVIKTADKEEIKHKNVKKQADEKKKKTEEVDTCVNSPDDSYEKESESADTSAEKKKNNESSGNTEVKLVKYINDNKEKFESMIFLLSDMVETDEDRQILNEFVNIIKEL